MKKEQLVLRHGDVVIFKVSDDDNAELNPNTVVEKLILAEGEATGHIHQVSPMKNSQVLVCPQKNETGSRINRSQETETIFRVSGKAVIMHQEHEPLVIEEGKYVRRIQRVYEPFTKQIEKNHD